MILRVVQRLRQVAENVAHVVVPASLHPAGLPKTWPTALRSALEPSITNSRARAGSTPRSTSSSSRASATTEFSLAPSRVPRIRFVPIRAHAQRHQHMVARELDAVEVHDQVVPVVQPPLGQLLQPFARCLGSPSAYRRPAHPRGLRHLPDRLAVCPRADAAYQQLQHPVSEPFRTPQRLVGRDRNFAFAGASQARLLDPTGQVRQVYAARLSPVVRDFAFAASPTRLPRSGHVRGADLQHRLDRWPAYDIDDRVQRVSRPQFVADSNLESGPREPPRFSSPPWGNLQLILGYPYLMSQHLSFIHPFIAARRPRPECPG